MQRKLTAILSADVVGYSGIMEVDEAATLEKLKTNRTRIFDPQVAIHGGRVFKLMGDGALVEFASVIAAVNCALAIQEASEKATADDEKPIRYRIGINLGEVIVEGDDIYGEGVNVASRIQALAPVGGVAVSRVVHDQTNGKGAFHFEDMGEHAVKNIAAPVHVFSVRGGTPKLSTAVPTEAPRKLSVCVLPFANMSGDIEQEYFSDGISEDIITDLSKVSALSVIARNTAFQYRGKNVDVALVAKQLRVSHVLEGSVRKSGGRVRITAQLIDGGTGAHLWAERYDRDLNDIFALQDEISEAIVSALKLQLLPAEKIAIERRGTDNVDAYNRYLLARRHYSKGMLRHRDLIIRLCKAAIDIDPAYAEAWGLLAICQADLRFRSNLAEESGWEAAERALSLNPAIAEAHSAKGRILVGTGRNDEAAIEHEAALALDPKSYEVNCSAARWLISIGDNVRAAALLETAIGLSNDDYWAAGMVRQVYDALGDRANTERAARLTVEQVQKTLASEPANAPAITFGVGALIALGEIERAKAWAEQALLIDPDTPQVSYNIACAMARMGETGKSLEILERLFSLGFEELFHWIEHDNDLARLRDLPRFKVMMSNATARFAAQGEHLKRD